MPKIDFNDYQKSLSPESNSTGDNNLNAKTLTVSMLKVSDTQYLVKEEGILIDLIDLDLEDGKYGVEAWISYLGGNYKIKCGVISRKDLEAKGVDSYICEVLTNSKKCLECKNKFFENFCDLKENGLLGILDEIQDEITKIESKDDLFDDEEDLDDEDFDDIELACFDDDEDEEEDEDNDDEEKKE